MSSIVIDRRESPAGARRSPAKVWLRALEAAAPIGRLPHRLLADVIDDFAQTSPDAPALLSQRESFTYAELAARVNRYARWVNDQQLRQGETVGLLMPNRPDYLAAWLGISRMGCVVALFNTNLTGTALAHCINLVAPRHIIVDATLIAAYESAKPHVDHAVAAWSHGEQNACCASLDAVLENLSGAPLTPDERRTIATGDIALNIFTSGTTGLPKAANVSHARVLFWSLWFAGMMDVTAADRMYDCLPLYHSVGGVVATGALLVKGGSVIIAEGFSARRFWKDVREGECTLVQYIGELCRYLLNVPHDPGETRHRIRICCGNGLRDGVWQAFQSRFAIPHILEFYAATEGNVALYNVEAKPGAIGRVPAFLAHRFPTALVRLEGASPQRGDDGLCVPCGVDEIGEAIGQITADSSHPAGRFEGYTDSSDSERKIVRNVFAPGDAWFRTGDLMRRDAAGFFYFVDRIGDTFRWKGENVSTFEVELAIGTCPGVKAVCVYGVDIPDTDGRAGMAALSVTPDFDVARLRSHLEIRLPPYARPVFLRICAALQATGTFKHQKETLTQQGFSPAAGGDLLFVNDVEQGAYVPLDAATYQRIAAGRMRF